MANRFRAGEVYTEFTYDVSKMKQGGFIAAKLAKEHGDKAGDAFKAGSQPGFLAAGKEGAANLEKGFLASGVGAKLKKAVEGSLKGIEVDFSNLTKGVAQTSPAFKELSSLQSDILAKEKRLGDLIADQQAAQRAGLGETERSLKRVNQIQAAQEDLIISKVRAEQKYVDTVSDGVNRVELLANRVGRAARSTAEFAAKAVAFGTGIATAFTVATKKALESAADIKVLSDVAGVNSEKFQEMAVGARTVGISQEKLSDQLKDVQDRIGDLILNGGGPLQDFLDSVGYQAGLTAEDFRNLSSDQALGLVIRTMEEAGATGGEMTNVLESLASDSKNLLPLLANGGKGFRELGREARATGDILEDEYVQSSFDANVKLQQLGKTIRTGFTRAIVESAPEIEALTDKIIALTPRLVGWADAAAEGFNKVAEAINRSFTADGDILAALPDAGTSLLEKDLEDFVRRRDEARAKVERNGFFGLFAERDKRELEKLEGFVEVTQQKIDEIRARSGGSTTNDNEVISLIAQESLTTRRRRPASGNQTTDGRQELEVARERNQALAEYNRLLQDTQTPLEAYEARLGQITELERNLAVQMIDADPEAFSRARADAMIEYAEATQSTVEAHRMLAEAVINGSIAEQDAANVRTALREQALAQTQEALQVKLDADAEYRQMLRGQLDKRLEIIDAMAFQIDRELGLARLAGDETRIRVLERELELMRERRRLTVGGVSDADAQAGAREYVQRRDAAILEGEQKRLEEQHREAFRTGIEGALSELEGPLNSMFDEPIGTLANALFDFIDAFKNLGSEGGSGGGGFLGLLSSFDFLFGIGSGGQGGSSSVPSFNGGGFTGFGARSGGIDGRGGFPAILHPNEVVTDLTGPLIPPGGLERPRENVIFEVRAMKGDVFDAEVYRVSGPVSDVSAEATVQYHRKRAARMAGRQFR